MKNLSCVLRLQDITHRKSFVPLNLSACHEKIKIFSVLKNFIIMPCSSMFLSQDNLLKWQWHSMKIIYIYWCCLKVCGKNNTSLLRWYWNNKIFTVFVLHVFLLSDIAIIIKYSEGRRKSELGDGMVRKCITTKKTVVCEFYMKLFDSFHATEYN